MVAQCLKIKVTEGKLKVAKCWQKIMSSKNNLKKALVKAELQLNTKSDSSLVKS